MAAYEAAFPARAVPDQMQKSGFRWQLNEHGGIKAKSIRNLWRRFG